MAAREVGRSSFSNAGTIVVIVLLVGALGVIWGSLSTMVTQMRPAGPFQEPTGSTGAELKGATQQIATVTGGGGGASGTVAEELQALAEVAPQVEALAAEPVPLPPEARALPQASEVQAAQRALDDGDCIGASDALFASGQLTPAGASVVEDVWRCFDGQGGLDTLTLADETPAPGLDADEAFPPAKIQAVEGRLQAFEGIAAGGFTGYLEDLIGAASLAAQVQGGLDAEALMADWASAAPADQRNAGFLADRIQALSGGLSGAPGRYLAAQDPDAYDALDARLADQLSAADLPPEVRQAWLDGMTMGIQDPVPAPPEAAEDPPAEAPGEQALDTDEVCDEDEVLVEP